MLHLSKHPNPDARGINGQSENTCDLSLTPIEFFEKNNRKLLGYCHRCWNGSGEEVFWEAVNRSLKYEYMTFSLFNDLCHSAARNLKISRWQHDEEGTIILPPVRQPKLVCEKCGSTKFVDTMGYQKMCVCCGEKVDPQSPILDPGEDEDTDDIDTEKLEEIRKNIADPKIQAVIEAVMAGENLVEATRQTGISYSTWRKKARQAWIQPSLFSEKNSTSEAYISIAGGAR